jgi:hypothetical protein
VIKGDREIIANLENVLKIFSKTQVEALEEVGQRGVGILKLNTPVDTGRLRNSMGYTVANKVEGGENTVNRTSEKDSVYLGTNVIYAPSVEYRSKNGSQGFMLRSFNQLVPIAKKIIENSFKGAIR